MPTVRRALMKMRRNGLLKLGEFGQVCEKAFLSTPHLCLIVSRTLTNRKDRFESGAKREKAPEVSSQGSISNR